MAEALYHFLVHKKNRSLLQFFAKIRLNKNYLKKGVYFIAPMANLTLDL